MDRPPRWLDHVTVNVHWWGLSIAKGIITPLLLPSLVALFVPWDLKNTYLAAIRVAGLTVAMMIQPMAGLLSDRSTLRWGRRRPYIAAGTLLSFLFLLLVGLSPRFAGSTWALSPSLPLAYAVLLAGVVLWQGAVNVAQGALQGLIPDLIPGDHRGRASGVRAVMEILALVPILLTGPLVDAGRQWLVLAVIVACVSLSLLITLLGVHEQPAPDKPRQPARGQGGRLAGQAILFVAISQAAVWTVRQGNTALGRWGAPLPWRIALVGLLALLGTVVAIVLGVRLGMRLALGDDLRRHTPFVWWVVNRLLFMAAAGSVQGFTLYYLADVHHVAGPAALTTRLGAVLAVSLALAALAGGAWADRVGRLLPLALAGLVAAAGTLLLIVAPGLPLVVVGVCVLGIATGLFTATNWALGTDLVPPREAGRFLGISNLAGAGAGIAGAGIGGPMVDLINAHRPGLGYLVAFGLYGVLFLLSAAVVPAIRPRGGSRA